MAGRRSPERGPPPEEGDDDAGLAASRQEKRSQWDVSVVVPAVSSKNSSSDPPRRRGDVASTATGAVLALQMANPIGAKRHREIYVGNLAPAATKASVLKDLFQNLMASVPSFDATAGPAVAQVQICSTGMYAFVEFRDETLATTALKFHGLDVSGRSLKIGRPGGYVEPALPAPGLEVPTDVLRALGISGVGSTYVAGSGPIGLVLKKQRELYVGNLPALADVTSVRDFMTRPLNTALGSTESVDTPVIVHVEFDPSRKFCFVEFKDDRAATVALHLFSNVDFGGKLLKVGRPSGYTEYIAAAAVPSPLASSAAITKAILATTAPPPVIAPAPTTTIISAPHRPTQTLNVRPPFVTNNPVPGHYNNRPQSLMPFAAGFPAPHMHQPFPYTAAPPPLQFMAPPFPQRPKPPPFLLAPHHFPPRNSTTNSNNHPFFPTTFGT